MLPYSASPKRLLPLTSYQDSSIAESIGAEDLLQVSASHRNASSVATNLQDSVVSFQDGVDKSKFYCMVPRCQKSFKNLRDLKRHAKRHDPDSTLWYCGCCQNMRLPFRGKERKDKVQSHMRNCHDRFKSEENKGVNCPSGCATLFTAPSCLGVHLRDVHSDPTWTEYFHKTTIGKWMFLGRRCWLN